GRVRVDGVVVQEQGVRVDPAAQVIHVDGRRLQLDESTLTLVLNKPRGVVSAMSDPEGRRDLREFTAGHPQRLYHVGRLDYETEGLLDRKSTRLNSSHVSISYAVFCLKKKIHCN